MSASPLFPLITRVLIAVILVLLGGARDSLAAGPADKVYEAYYIERAKSDFAAAAKLYAEVAAAKDVTPEIRKLAQTRLAVCREELASTDLAKLMPPAPLAYVELNRPGERVRKLLDQLGLLAHPDAPGQPAAPGQNRLAISPALVDALLGLRGAAVAITGVDMQKQRPSGVAVLHPGDMDVVRGMIETALPAAAEVVAPINGYPTYQIEDFYVTLTSQLVIAGSGPGEIEGVLARLKSPDEDSLATDPQLTDVLKDRHNDLLFFCVNPKPLLPLLDGFMAAAATQKREVVIARALLDPKSFRALSGHLNLGDEGLSLEFALHLEEGHRNLVYNFLRRPAIDKATLRCVPPGAAAFVALAMNPAPGEYETGRAAAGREPNEPPVVTALDIGRELFANINGIALYVLPSATDTPPTTQPARRLPDVAAAISVNDPAKSEALWTELLGIASLAAAGAPTMDGVAHDIAGTQVRAYRFDRNVTIQQATSGHFLFIATTESAMARSLEAKRSGKSIVDDPGFAPLLAKIGPHTTLAVLANAGRCAALARPYVPAGEVGQLAPFLDLLQNTSAFFTVEHSERLLRVSAAVTGVPNVSGLVNEQLTRARHQQRTVQEIDRAVRARQPEQALALLDRQLAEQSKGKEGAPSADSVMLPLLQKKFEVLASQKKDTEAALAVGEKYAQAMWGDPRALNDAAWSLLTEKKYGGRFHALALKLAQRSNELTQQTEWAYVDTLALAEFETGHADRAVELEQKAIALSKKNADGAGLADMQKALQRFKATGGSAREKPASEDNEE